MKLKNILYIALLFILTLSLGACKKEKFNINSNPDDVTDNSVTPAVILPGALQNTSRLVAVDWAFLQMWLGYWARSGSYQSLTEIETYRFGNDFQLGIWNDLYSNANNYDIMVRKAKASGAGFYEAIGRIMKAHNFGILVDVYNNVPYFQAFQGTVAATPKYDSGLEIYKDLFKQLDTAVTLLKTPTAIEAAKNADIKTSDLVYGGDANAWIRFSNTLRLRLIVHLLNGTTSTTVASSINVSAEAAKVTSEGFINTGQSAHINPGFSATKPNPYYRSYVQDESGTQRGDINRANDYAIRYYTANGDPRIDQFYVAPGSGHKGNLFGRPSDATGLYTGDKLSTVRGPGLIPKDASSRAWILTSVESLFLQAEARERGVLTSGVSAQNLLTNAVRESFVWLGLTTADADDYFVFNTGYPDVDYTAPPKVPGEPGGGIITILHQKWFALNSIATYEVWTDYRRTDIVYGKAIGFSSGPPISVDPNNTATKIPYRLLYPQNEYNYNAANVGAQGTINVFTNKIFWDLN